MPSVRAREGESADSLLRRLKRQVEKSGILAKVRACEFYEKPTAKRKRKKAAAIKRTKKKMMRDTMSRVHHY